MPIPSSGDHRARLRDYIKIEDLNDQIQDTMLNYLLTMHNLSEGTKEQYLQRLRQFGKWLMQKGHKSFEEVDKATIDLFLSGHKNKGTINTYITVFKPFYSALLNKKQCTNMMIPLSTFSMSWH